MNLNPDYMIITCRSITGNSTDFPLGKIRSGASRERENWARPGVVVVAGIVIHSPPHIQPGARRDTMS